MRGENGGNTSLGESRAGGWFGRLSGSGGRAAGAGHLAGGGAQGLQAQLGQYALLPLRIFLGITFIYAGIDKLTDSAFMSASGPDSIGETMRSVQQTAAIPPMVDMALEAPLFFGYAIGIGEVAAGIGTLFGILARVAALGGMCVSLSLWLTVTWATEPYYYGNDLAYAMAWLPLVLAGAPYLSVDALLRDRRKWSRGDGGDNGDGAGDRDG
ncbi:DoxX family protein [Streptomyces sp. NA04227]|nr:DoxX family protein [Streptomyces sp. NA04227]